MLPKLSGSEDPLPSEKGAERASALANRTLRKVYKKVGFVPRQ